MAHSKFDGKRLLIDDRPFIILGGELGNSSASCVEDVKRIFPQLKTMNLNTVLVPAYWDLIEPEEDTFDFSLTDEIIDEAKANGLKVVFLWFGAWKNSMSCYAPLWFKKDTLRFPRAVTSKGKPLEIASTFSDNVYNADSKAFKAWLRHIKEYDKDGTVIMIQLENEIGMLEDARDHSQLAQAEYDKGVPNQLIAHLKQNKWAIDSTIFDRWQKCGFRDNGPWTSVFGNDIYTDEYFMAWNYAKYVGRLAKEARKITDMPLYVNAALNSRGRRPGEYPSAGPLAHLKDIWHAAAPDVDFVSPDIYDSGFKDWVGKYALPDNTLFIPEIKREDANGAEAFYVFGQHNAIGICPFSIENGNASDDAPTVKAYAKLAELMPIITQYQHTGDMYGLYFDMTDKETVISRDGMKITANHFFTLPWDPRATDGSPWPAAGGIIVRTAADEYIVAGSGIVVKFEDENESQVKQMLGEDGFLNAGNDRKDAVSWNGGQRIGLGPVDEVKVNADGTLQYVRRDNGDETHQGRHVRIGVDDWRILRVKLYKY